MKRAVYFQKEVFPDISKGINPQANDILTKVAIDQLVEIYEQQKADPNTKSDYIIGAALPILILGVCGFVTAGRWRRLLTTVK